MKKIISLRKRETQGNNIHENFFNIFAQYALNYPQKPAIIMQNQLVTYNSLLIEVKKMIFALHNFGIKNGDHIIVALQPSVEIVKTFLSSLSLGAVYVPIDPSFPKGRLQFIINEIKPSLVITDKKHSNNFSIDPKKYY